MTIQTPDIPDATLAAVREASGYIDVSRDNTLEAWRRELSDAWPVLYAFAAEPLTARLKAVEALHQRTFLQMPAARGGAGHEACSQGCTNTDGEDVWPCPTVLAIKP